MDENLTNVVETAIRDFKYPGSNHKEWDTEEAFVSKAVTAAGYRLDPYPNGKSKPELIDIIAQKDASLSRARNFLRAEHERRVKETFAITMDRHRELKPDCDVCWFLAETSSVKP